MVRVAVAVGVRSCFGEAAVDRDVIVIGGLHGSETHILKIAMPHGQRISGPDPGRIRPQLLDSSCAQRALFVRAANFSPASTGMLPAFVLVPPTVAA
jgi:hypothetical protein